MKNRIAIIRAIILSLLGIVIFFVEIQIGDKKQIPLEHLVKFIQKEYFDIVKYFTLSVIIVGAVKPFYNKSWNDNKTKAIFSCLGILAIPLAAMYFIGFGPVIINNDTTLIYMFNKLALPVSLYIPIGSVALAFILSYGLLEFVGVLVRPFIRPIFKTPGKSAIDAVASFVGSYALGLLITNRVYQEGKYTAKEASIIATGFSTVSVTFMIIVKDTAGLNDHWLVFFWTALFVTFFTTFVMVRLRPIESIPNEYYQDQVGHPETEYKGSVMMLIKRAAAEAGEVAISAPPVLVAMKHNFVEAMNMSLVVIPLLLSVGTLGMVVANHTVVFDIVGMIFYPVFYLISPTESFIASKAVSIGFVEMFLPVTYLASVGDVSLMIRFIVAVTSISTILFLSATIPCIMATKIPIKFNQIVYIFIQRAFISIMCTYLVFQVLMAFNMIY